MRILKSLAFSILLSFVMLTSAGASFVYADGASHSTPTTTGGSVICNIFPFLNGISFASSLCGSNLATAGQDAGKQVRNLVQFGLSLVFIAIIIFSVYIIIKAALKYIRSEGDESKIQEAQKAIKSVFIGIAALFIGVIGILIILAFFNATNTGVNDTPNQINNVFGQ